MTKAKRLFNVCLLGAATAWLAAACTQEEEYNFTELPAGKYPIDFTAKVFAPASSRASVADGQWNSGDNIHLRMNQIVRPYTAVSSGGTTSFKPFQPGEGHYWLSTAPATVDGWHYGRTYHTDAPTRWSVLADQNTPAEPGTDPYQQSAFLYAPARTFTHDGDNSLMFYQQTAKVNIHIRQLNLSNTGMNRLDLFKLTIGNADNPIPLEATFDSERTATDPFSGLEADPSGEQGFITPQLVEPADAAYALSYRALLVPQDFSGKKFICIKHGLSLIKEAFYIPLPGEADLRGGYEYTFVITVSHFGAFEFDVLPESITGWDHGPEQENDITTKLDISTPQTITDNNTYLVSGEGTSSITVRGASPTIILEEARIACASPILVVNGRPTVLVRGHNSTLTGVGTPGIELRGADANIDILGDHSLHTTLTVAGGVDEMGLAKPGIGNGNEAAFGTITLKNLTLNVSGGQPGSPQLGGAAAIGGRAEAHSQGGGVLIEGCHINAEAFAGGAAIGFGYSNEPADVEKVYRMGTISLTQQTTMNSKVHKGPNGLWPAHLGGAAINKGFSYKLNEIVFSYRYSQKDYFANFTYADADDEQDRNDVIAGFPDWAEPREVWEVYWNRSTNKDPAYIRWSTLNTENK